MLQPQLAEQLRRRLAPGRPPAAAGPPAPAPARARARGGSPSSPAAFSAGALHGAFLPRAPRPGPTRRAASPARPARRAPAASTRAPPGTTKPRTSPPAASASGRRVNSESANASERSRISMPHAQVGLVRSVLRDRLGVRHAAGTAAARSRPMSAISRSISGSMVANTRSSVANDISRSTCVNSGCRSARRSSSRKHLTIWK